MPMTQVMETDQADGLMQSIGDLAAELEISHRTIRFYEDQGLLSPRRIGGNRIYTPRDRARLKLILRGKRLGFSLTEIGELLDLYDVDPHHLEQLRATLKRGRARLAELEAQRVELDQTLNELRSLETTIINTIAAIEASTGTEAAATERSGS